MAECRPQNYPKLKDYKPSRFMLPTCHYDAAKADRAVTFIENLRHTKGKWAGKRFWLLPWQEQIIRDVFGIVDERGNRQFRTAYVEIGKKNGKSELAAAVALLLTCGDGEERAEVYGCAADRQQASIVFNVAADMVRMCPALSKRVKILDSQKRLIYQPTGSIYQVLSADVGNKHGFNTHGVVFDELHTQPNRKLFDVMTKGSGDARMQPLYFLITTAGNDTNSICYEVHQKAIDIAEGRKIDPTFLFCDLRCIGGRGLDRSGGLEESESLFGIQIGVTKHLFNFRTFYHIDIFFFFYCVRKLFINQFVLREEFLFKYDRRYIHSLNLFTYIVEQFF